MASVYVIGFPNGKCYVGVTVKAVEERFKGHVWDSRRPRPRPRPDASEFGDECA